MQRLFKRVARVAGTATCVLLSGCLSDRPGSSSLASVEIVSHTEDVVRAEAVRVFADENYQLVSEPGGPMVFEREATRNDRLKYGSLGDQAFIMRVTVTLEHRRQGGVLVRADAFVVKEGVADKVIWVGRRPYQALLDALKASLVEAKLAK
jgi:hypothetical protein